MGKFVVKNRKNGDFQFDLKATNGQVILSSQGYKSKRTCLQGIESVKRNSQVDARFERKEAKDGSPYFNLKATNGQIIGTSEMYSSVAAMENGIASVAKNALEAVVEDTTLEA
ncbi:MAG: YegP family protein [Bacteroidales bacterium]|nr:YegP family protein [Bacteroidales bacterium]